MAYLLTYALSGEENNTTRSIYFNAASNAIQATANLILTWLASVTDMKIVDAQVTSRVAITATYTKVATDETLPSINRVLSVTCRYNSGTMNKSNFRIPSIKLANIEGGKATAACLTLLNSFFEDTQNRHGAPYQLIARTKRIQTKRRKKS